MRVAPTTICTLIFCAAVCLSACNDEPGDADATDEPDATDAAEISDSGGDADADASADANADDTDADDSLAPASYFEQQDALAAELRCKRLYQCPEVYSARTRKQLSTAAPRAACPEMLAEYYVAIPSLGSVEAGRIDFDEDAASACLDEYRAYLEADGCPDLDDWWDACDNVLAPAVPEGGDCLHPSDCIGETYCTNSVVDRVCEMGTCEPTLAEGQTCTSAAPWGECGDDLSCEYDGEAWRCSAPEPPPEEGDECNISRCGGELLCHDRENVCVTAQFAEIGDVCDYRTVCPVGTTCSQDIGKPTMRCRTLASVGEPCVQYYHRCRLGLECSDEGVCVEPPELGDPCESSSDCARLNSCYEGECATVFELCE
jgi:hypothetical protein